MEKDWEEIKPNYPYTVKEVAYLLRLSDITLRNYLRKGLIRSLKIGTQYRILGKDILALFNKGEENE